MARYAQRKQEDGSYKLVPVDDAAKIREGVEINVRGNFDAFRSIVDGTLIRNQRDLDEHNKRNNVVNTHEFGTEHWERKRKEREALFTGEHSTAQKQLRGEEIHRIIERLERR